MKSFLNGLGILYLGLARISIRLVRGRELALYSDEESGIPQISFTVLRTRRRHYTGLYMYI